MTTPFKRGDPKKKVFFQSVLEDMKLRKWIGTFAQIDHITILIYRRKYWLWHVSYKWIMVIIPMENV